MSHLDNLSLRELRQLAYAKMRLPIVEEQERQACRGGLIHFVRYFWHILEPKTKLVEGWPLEAICEHLEAVTFGEITHALLNVPPGFMKSLLTDVLWPAWEWGPMNMPHLRYVTFSYSVSLTMRDNGRFRDLLMSEPYQKLWGKRFGLRKVGEERVTNNKTGWKLASSIGGLGTGERGDRVICFPYWEKVATAHGPMPIGEIVERRLFIEVWSLNLDTNQIELKPIVGWHTNPSATLVRIETECGAVTCTEDHRIMTIDGYKGASSLLVGDWLLAAPAGMFTSGSAVMWPQRQIKVLPDAPVSNAGYGLGTASELSGQNQSRIGVTFGNLPDNLLSEMRDTIFKRSMSLAVGDILRPRAIFKVIKSWISSIAVLVADFLSFGTRTDKGFHDHLMSESVISPACQAHSHARVAFVESGSEYSSWHGHGNAFAHNRSGDAPDASEVRGFIQTLKALHRFPDLQRVTAISHVQELPPATYCLTVADNHSMLCGDVANIICANCDDPHNVKESESDPVRQEAIRWFKESMSNRLNDVEKSAVIVIMQRVHEEDVSGIILSEFPDYCHLMIPMRFDPTRYPIGYNGNDIGWMDPREEDGDYAWPERFPPSALAQFERQPYMWAGQYQQSPTPRGGGIIKEEMWQLWPSEKYPQCELVLGSLDTASTEKEQNDASALTIWGIFRDGQGSPKAILLYAWEGRLEINDLTILVGLLCSVEKRPSEEYQRALALFNRGDVQVDALYRLPVDRLLVENKNNGISVAHELMRLFGHAGNFAVELIDPKVFGDKVARIIACEPMFADEMIYAPDREFAERVITNVAGVPKTSKWDTPDSVSQALLYMRKTGLLLRKDEQARVTHDELLFKPQPPPLY